MTQTLQNINYSIQYLPASERPRERLTKHGPDVMTTAELIAIILGSGMKGVPVLQLAQDIIARFGDMQRLGNATVEELCTIKGLGPAKALQLKAAISLGIRVARKAPDIKPRISQPMQAYHLIKEEMENHPRELFMTVLLDTKGYLISNHIISVGTIAQTLVHPREVFYPAIRHHAATIILAHNHPTGDPTPSPQDINVTKKLVEVGKILGIPVSDHLIIGFEKFVSLRETNVNLFMG